jgi:hypothetical protein
MNNGFRSPLEEKAGILLIENNISFAYEPVSVILVPGFEYGGRVVEGRGKRLVEKRPKNFPITYKPDFVGLN